jgi:hypothetical protein
MKQLVVSRASYMTVASMMKQGSVENALETLLETVLTVHAFVALTAFQRLTERFHSYCSINLLSTNFLLLKSSIKSSSNFQYFSKAGILFVGHRQHTDVDNVNQA